MFPDGLSYLDIASNALRSGPSELLNSYWSPGYPVILSIALALSRPSPIWEFPVVHIVNFLIFALDLFAFRFFLKNWLAYHDVFYPTGDAQKRNVIALGYFTFLWFSLDYIGISNVSPDLCFAAMVFFAAGITCRLAVSGATPMRCGTLGIVFGIGYYVKAPMFPLALVFFGAVLLFPPFEGLSRRKLLLSFSVFLLTIAPFIVLLSRRAGHFTFGESSNLNYLWSVNRIQPWGGWSGSDSGQTFASVPVYGLMPPAPTNSQHLYGIPEHPPRRLMEKPLILEFGSPINSTFPLWYDPPYWYAGAKAKFDMRKQIEALKETLGEYKRMFKETEVLFGGAVVLLILAARRVDLHSFLRRSWLLIFPLAGVFIYAPVHVESRYIGGFLVLFTVPFYGTLMARVDRRIAAAVCATVIATMMIPLMAHMAGATAQAASDVLHSTEPDYQRIADSLRLLGLQRGDRLAVLGYPFNPYYARFAGMRLIAEIPATEEFRTLTAPALTEVAAQLSQIGVKALVAQNAPLNGSVGNWHDVRVSGTDKYSVLLLSKLLPNNPPQ